jgi:glycosyltransferase involved in cell wall biosynthesis
MRVLFLHNGLLAYQDVCLRALADLGDEIMVVHPEGLADSHFREDEFLSYGRDWSFKGDEPPDPAELLRAVEEFEPDVIVMRAWKGKAYRKVVRAFRGRALRVMFSSNVWLNAPRQWVGRATHRVYVDPLFDAAYVPGERSEWFVRRLGFAGEDIIRGANSADVALFDRGERKVEELASRRRFLYSGRLIWHKAVDTLAPAYALYREMVEDPWEISIVGKGDQANLFDGIEGVTMHGFAQPEELADLMHESSCFVLASHVDFWGVVVHEAGTAGLPLICSDGVGAVPYLLQDGFNGWVVPAGNAGRLAEAMVRMSSASPDALRAMSAGSQALSSRLSPEIWARHLHDEMARRVPAARRGTTIAGRRGR